MQTNGNGYSRDGNGRSCVNGYSKDEYFDVVYDLSDFEESEEEFAKKYECRKEHGLVAKTR